MDPVVVGVLVELLAGLGATVSGVGTSTLRVKCEKVVTDRPDPALVGKLRGSVLLLGPLLARTGSARLAPPGGDFPARRTISTHLQALAALGAFSRDEPGHSLETPRLSMLMLGVYESAALQAAGATPFSIDTLLPELEPLLATPPEWFAYCPEPEAQVVSSLVSPYAV